MEKKEVPIWEKANLTIDEAAAYFGIGTNKLRDITSNPDCEFVIWVRDEEADQAGKNLRNI